MTDITSVIIPIVTLVLSICTIVITKYIIPFIQAKVTTAQWTSLIAWSDTFVRAAEVLIQGVSGLGKERREMVMKKLKEKCEEQGWYYSEDDIRAALESSLTNMKNEISKAGEA